MYYIRILLAAPAAGKREGNVLLIGWQKRRERKQNKILAFSPPALPPRPLLSPPAPVFQLNCFRNSRIFPLPQLFTAK